jgi:hypothetical protein
VTNTFLQSEELLIGAFHADEGITHLKPEFNGDFSHAPSVVAASRDSNLPHGTVVICRSNPQ